jgi:ATP-binding cassette subfamily B protein RaxB
MHKVALPAILHWNFSHFVVLRKLARGGRFEIVDPAAGARVVDATEMSRAFTGVALEVSPSAGFVRRKERSSLSVFSMIRFRGGVGQSLVQALLLSVLLQAYVVGSPFFMQLAIDEAALKGDLGLLTTLAIGFGLFAMLNSGAEVLRSLVLQRVSSILSWDMTTRLFHHMLRLPLSWFQRRRLADALTRFDSLDPIRNLVANGFVAAILDGTLGVALIIAMFVYLPSLALVVLAIAVVLCAIKLVSIPFSIRLAMTALQHTIVEKGKRIETLRAMQTIKLLGGEAGRERDWSNRFGDTVMANENVAHFQIGVKSALSLVESVGAVIVVYLGAKNVLSGAFSVGMLYAFLSFRQQFNVRLLALVDQIVAWRMLDMHSDRLADIALERREEGIDRPAPAGFEPAGRVELDKVSFRYSPFEKFVIREISLTVEPGQLIAIVGASGGGKSTLLKALTGLYPATTGEVRYDGVPLPILGPNAVRGCLGVVMQDDELLSGSIIDNVTFFDEKPDPGRVWECLALSAIDDEIRLMPMQLHSLIGDMGSGISGGQRQRLLLARALYRKPRVLVLDEATSNLDVARERRIHEALRSLSITRILVTHRPETMRLADHVYELHTGRLTLVRQGLVADSTSPHF